MTEIDSDVLAYEEKKMGLITTPITNIYCYKFVPQINLVSKDQKWVQIVSKKFTRKYQTYFFLPWEIQM